VNIVSAKVAKYGLGLVLGLVGLGLWLKSGLGSAVAVNNWLQRPVGDDAFTSHI